MTTPSKLSLKRIKRIEKETKGARLGRKTKEALAQNQKKTQEFLSHFKALENGAPLTAPQIKYLKSFDQYKYIHDKLKNTLTIISWNIGKWDVKKVKSIIKVEEVIKKFDIILLQEVSKDLLKIGDCQGSCPYLSSFFV